MNKPTEPDRYIEFNRMDAATETADWDMNPSSTPLLDKILKTPGSSAASSTVQISSTGTADYLRVASELTKKYPHITVDNDVLGEPRIVNSRLGVSIALTALTEYGSFDEVIKEYDDTYTEEELKETVLFARDFLDAFYARP